jgi:hypothetical protein
LDSSQDLNYACYLQPAATVQYVNVEYVPQKISDDVMKGKRSSISLRFKELTGHWNELRVIRMGMSLTGGDPPVVNIFSTVPTLLN